MSSSLPSQEVYMKYVTTKPADLAMNSMEILREADWSEGLCPNFDGRNSESYKEATTGYQRGQVQSDDKVCQMCKDKNGIFKQCVRVMMPDGNLAFGGKCCNCHFYRKSCKEASKKASKKAKSAPANGPHCGCTGYCNEESCACFKAGMDCRTKHCACSKCDNPFHEFPIIFKEAGVRANGCLRSHIIKDQFSHYNLEDLQKMIIDLRDSFFKYYCPQDEELKKWLARYSRENDKNSSKKRCAMEIIRYGLTDSKRLSDPKSVKPYFYSLCRKEWVRNALIGHCEVCDKCHTLGGAHYNPNSKKFE